MSRHNIAVIGGDGIGPEVVEAGVTVLEALASTQPDLDFDFKRFDWGSDYYRRTGRMMAEDGLDQIEDFRVTDTTSRATPQHLYALLRDLYDRSSLYRQSGGVHT